MRRVLAVSFLAGLAGCAPRIPPPDEMSERDAGLTRRIEESSLADLDHTLEQILREEGETSPGACQAWTDVGVALIYRDEPQASVHYFERALAVCEAVYGHEHRETSYALHDYGEAQVRAAGETYEPRARPWYEEALAVRRRVLGNRHEETAAAEVSLGRHILASCRAQPPCAVDDSRLQQAWSLGRHAQMVFDSVKVPKVSDQSKASNLLKDIGAQRRIAASEASRR